MNRKTATMIDARTDQHPTQRHVTRHEVKSSMWIALKMRTVGTVMKVKTATGNMTGIISLAREAVTMTGITCSHMMPGRLPMERAVAVAVTTETEIEIKIKISTMTHGKDITVDMKQRHTIHGHPGDARKFAEVVNSVQLLSIILSLNFLTHRIHPTILAE